MAEARIEEEEDGMRESRDPGARLTSRRATVTSERAERNKPEQRHSSQGAFSSIRNVIKRTSTRSTSFRSAPVEHSRDRRRPEITILSAEPLANNAWYPGPPAQSPTQSSWSNSILTVQLPPPSYEQVIREKSLEENVSSSSSSSCNPTSSVHTPSAVSTPSTAPAPSPVPCASSSSSSSSSSAPPPSTASIATQTDLDVPSAAHVGTRRPDRRPPKPPPPALPLAPKLAEYPRAHTRSLIDLDSPDSSNESCGLPHACSGEIPSGPLSEQCGVHAGFSDREVAGDLARHNSAPALSDSSPESHNPPLQCPMKQKVSARPRPHPRSKGGLQPVIAEDVLDQPMTREVKVQTLVRIKDDDAGCVFAGFTDSSSEFASNKYMQELLDVFGSDEQCLQSNQDSETDQCAKSEEEEEEGSESSYSTVVPHPSAPLERPKPKPRTKNPKLPVTPKPSSPTHGVLEAESSSEGKSKQEESEEKQSPPMPAPRPVLNKTSPSQQQSTSEEGTPEASRLPQPPRHPVAARRSKDPAQAEGAPPGRLSAGVPPKALASPAPAPDPTTAAVTASAERGKGPLGPKQTHPASPAKLHSQKKTPPSSARATGSKASPSRLLPVRPPPIKLTKSAGSSQSNATANQLPGYRVPKRGPPLPPRPKPGHPLYRDYTGKVQANVNQKQTGNKAAREEPHSQKESLVAHDNTQTHSSRMARSHGGDSHEDARPATAAEASSQPRPKQEPRAERQDDGQARLNVGDSCVVQFAFEGEQDELTLCEGDVITLLERVNDEWGRGSLNGQTGLFPLSFVQPVPELSSSRKMTPKSPGIPAPVYVGGQQTGRAMFDFRPECDDELCLKMGDIVCTLESVDEQWFEGEFRGRRGIVPKSYIQILKDPDPLP